MIILRQKEFGVWGSLGKFFRRTPSLGTPSMSNVKPMSVPRLNSRQKRSMTYRDPKSGIFNIPKDKIINYTPTPIQPQGPTINFRDARKTVNTPKVDFSNKRYNGPRGSWGLGGNAKIYNIPRKTPPVTQTVQPSFSNGTSSTIPSFSQSSTSGVSGFGSVSNSSSVNIPKPQVQSKVDFSNKGYNGPKGKWNTNPNNTKVYTIPKTNTSNNSMTSNTVTEKGKKGIGFGGMIGLGSAGVATGIGLSMLGGNNKDNNYENNKDRK